MSLICPECNGLSFQIIDSVECGRSGGADERTIQRARCADCKTLFFCEYQSTRSFNPDRDDHETHYANISDHDIWARGAGVFETPNRKVSSDDRITTAVNLLECVQNNGIPGKPVIYSAEKTTYEPSSLTPPKNMLADLFGKFSDLFRSKT